MDLRLVTCNKAEPGNQEDHDSGEEGSPFRSLKRRCHKIFGLLH
jgi:hypothetical protein